MSVHTIQLAGPWQKVDEADSGQRTRLPVERLPGETFCLSRRFGRPGRLDSGERVWLVISGLIGPVEITLNQAPLDMVASPEGCRGDITDRLVSDNWLSIQWLGVESGELAGPVWLECIND